MLNIKFAQRRSRDADYVIEAIERDAVGTRGDALDLCKKKIEEQTGVKNVYMTNSATAALDVIAQALPAHCRGGEIIFPSWTFASTVSPFVRAGFKPVFVDVDIKTLNISYDTILKGLSHNTQAIVVVHYAGMAADMVPIVNLCNERGLFLIEDAAAAYLTPGCGMVGDFSVFSFNDTKNIGCGEGGCLAISDKHGSLSELKVKQTVDDLLNKGTDVVKARPENRQYTWTELGLAPQMTNLTAAFLLEELINAKGTTKRHQAIWHAYRYGLTGLSRSVKQMPFEGNGHFYWLLFPTPTVRAYFMEFMQIAGIQTSRHYQALHSSPAGIKYGTIIGSCSVSTHAQESIVRLPIYPSMEEDIRGLCENVVACANSALARTTQYT